MGGCYVQELLKHHDYCAQPRYILTSAHARVRVCLRCVCIGSLFPPAGVFTYTNGNRYAGFWQHGQRHGQGEMVYFSGTTYVGEVPYCRLDRLVAVAVAAAVFCYAVVRGGVCVCVFAPRCVCACVCLTSVTAVAVRYAAR